MRRVSTVGLLGVCLALSGCGVSKDTKQEASAVTEPIRIELDLSDPSRSFGVLTRGKKRTVFQVGFGRSGVTCAGSRFEEGFTPLGRFRVNGILSDNRFVMEPALIAQSGKSEAELRTSLFRSMNAIDFSGDGDDVDPGN
ncbi:MAG: hypothetical protein WBN89_07840 [Prochlorococcaceae cyanobacterium]